MRSLCRRWGSLILQGLALGVFCTGFFQWTPSALPPPRGTNTNEQRMLATMVPAQPVFDKLVFMVIDALRADFVYGDRLGREGFRWLRRQGGQRRDFIAMARAPTVTLPRIKALTAGTAPRFLDLLSNLHGEGTGGETEVSLKDSWVAQTSVLHYGDDTWMRLFPGLPGEGTHSFFVTDTVEVDRNVTRHLEPALRRTDWTVLTLHYLGVDHIGHTGGIASPLMIPKLQEMDDVIRRVYEGLVERDARDGTKSLMIILGDHGMTDTGNHGGASPDELRTAAIFLSPHYRERRDGDGDVAADADASGSNDNDNDNGGRIPKVIDQVDIAPTVALLLGLEVPRGSTGRFISAALPPGTGKDRRRTLLLKNAVQLDRLLHQVSTLTASASIEQLEAYIREASVSLSAHVGDYKSAHLIMGILLMGSSILVAPFDWTALGAGLVYGATQFASTFLEEEHFFWHFSFTSLCLLAWWLCHGEDSDRGRKGWRYLLVALAHRMIYYWNSTGYLHQNSPDIRGVLLKYPSAEGILWLMSFVLAGLIFIRSDWMQRQDDGLCAKLMRLTRLILLVLLMILGALMKLGPLEQTLLERIVLFLLATLTLTVLMGRGRRRDGSRNCSSRGFVLCLAFMILLKKHNALPMLLITIIASSCPLSSALGAAGPLDVGLGLSLLHSAYFLLGPCHLIPSIDFSPAYLGHTRYHPILIPLVGYFVIWAGPITVASVCHVPGQVVPLFRALVGTMLLVSVALQRNHLFVWTVFAPRLVFELGWHLFYLLFSLAKMGGRRPC